MLRGPPQQKGVLRFASNWLVVRLLRPGRQWHRLLPWGSRHFSRRSSSSKNNGDCAASCTAYNRHQNLRISIRHPSPDEIRGGEVSRNDFSLLQDSRPSSAHPRIVSGRGRTQEPANPLVIPEQYPRWRSRQFPREWQTCMSSLMKCSSTTCSSIRKSESRNPPSTITYISQQITVLDN